MKLLNLIPPGESTGWGLCGTQLAKYLPQFCEMSGPNFDIICADSHGSVRAEELDGADVVLAPVDNNRWGYHPQHTWVCETAKRRGIPIVGYGFHEFDIIGTQHIHWLPQNFTALACGSAWMRDWVSLALHGVADDFPLSVVLQGVDKDRFFYQYKDKPNELTGRFVVGSAGKFEFRKSQDVVIEAFRRFKKSVPEALLMFNWDTPWEQTFLSMKGAPYKCDLDLVRAADGRVYIAGVSPNLIEVYDQMQFREADASGRPIWRMLRNEEMPLLYQQMDVAVFPSRIEAAQSNNAVEACAMGIQSIIMDSHGMMDLVDAVDQTGCMALSGQKSLQYPKNDPVATIAEPCVEEILSCLFKAYRNRILESERETLSHKLDDWTWSKTASDIVALASKVV